MDLVFLVFATGVGLGSVEAQPLVLPDESQRRAVRGALAPPTGFVESAELRELRRFEEQAFPRHGGLPIRIYEPEDPRGASVVPPDLRGRWNGSGDVPEVLRPPETGRSVGDGETQPPNWLSKLKLPDLPVRFDVRVLRYLEYFKNDERGRAIMRGWLTRMGRYRELFERTLVREGLPRDLVFLAMIESGFQTAAFSYAGAGGIWQFMPAAARAYGLEVSYWVDGRRDPERSVQAAAYYLKDLYVRFGSWPLAMAAYNAGYGTVLQSIARYNTNDYWELVRHEAGLPWESTLYVPKILAAALVGHNLEFFGYADVVMDAPFRYEWVEVPAGTALATVARAIERKTEELEALNPELIRGRTPPDRGVQPVRVPVGTGALFAQGFSRAAQSERFSTVMLRFGETLADLARRYGTSEKVLRKVNGITNTAELRGGTLLLVPVREGETPAAVVENKNGDKGARDGATDDVLLVSVPDKVFNYPGRERVFYRVAPGDTLESVAGVFAVAIEDLAEWNSLDPAASIHEGMVFQVFVPEDFDAREVALLDPERLRIVTLGSEAFLELQAAQRGKTRLTYKARAGDTLAKIARRYGLSPGDLARINQISWNTELKDGDPVVVYSPTPELPREQAARTPKTLRPGKSAPPPVRQRSDKK